MSNKIDYYSIFVFILIILGCDESFTPEPDELYDLSVHGMLVTGTSEQYLSVVKVIKGERKHVEYVSDASVRVNGVEFSPIPEDEIYWRTAENWKTSSLKLTCGQVCYLQIHYRGQTITGITQIPDSARNVRFENPFVKWDGDSLNTLYCFGIEIPDFFSPDKYMTPPKTGCFFDCSSFFPYMETGFYKVRVMAYDDNYKAALAIDFDDADDPDSLSVGLENAYGIFCSASVWEGEVEFVF